MRRADAVLAIALLAFAAAIAREGWSLRYYTPMGPGPGFFPLWLSGLLAVLAVVVLAGARRAPVALPGDFMPPRGAGVRIAVLLAGLIACFLMVESVGFAVTLSGFLLLVLIAAGPVPLPIALGVAVVGGFGVVQLFRGFLRVGLPAGPFGF